MVVKPIRLHSVSKPKDHHLKTLGDDRGGGNRKEVIEGHGSGMFTHWHSGHCFEVGGEHCLD